MKNQLDLGGSLLKRLPLTEWRIVRSDFGKGIRFSLSHSDTVEDDAVSEAVIEFLKSNGIELSCGDAFRGEFKDPRHPTKTALLLVTNSLHQNTIYGSIYYY